MALKRIIAPASLAIDVDYVKSKLRVEHDQHDAMIESFIMAAIDYAEGPEGLTGRALIDQTWDLYLDAFPVCRPVRGPHWRRDDHIEIPLPPLIEVVGVFYLDSTGSEQELDAALYAVDDASQPARVLPAAGKSWPQAQCASNAVRIRFRAGYLDQTVSPAEDAVPENIKNGLYLHVVADYGPLDADKDDKLRATADQLLCMKRKHLGLA